MTEVGTLDGKEVLMLGDSNGQNIGRVFEYNKISFFLSSYIPFEQNCYFKFVFPPKLQIDDALQIIEGDGVFFPKGTSNSQLPTTSFTVDLQANTVYVEGCKDPDFLSSRPFGVINFSYVQLPDYVSDTSPVELYAYSDVAYNDLIFEESLQNGGGMVITKSMLEPGNLDLLEFTPSSYYAFVTDVTYTVSIRPHHDNLPSTRVIITMPENLKFDPTSFGGNGCRISYTENQNYEIFLAICMYLL